MFTNLGNGADTVYWGGMVYSNLPASPPMGSGLFKNGNYGKTCYMRQMNVRTVPGAPFVTTDDALVLYKNSRCYNATGYENVGSWGYQFHFGGKGGDIDHCKHWDEHCGCQIRDGNQIQYQILSYYLYFFPPSILKRILHWNWFPSLIWVSSCLLKG